jgi:predicted nucleic acid-binding protein
MRGLQLPRKRAILQALDLYASTALDFVDALNVAYLQDLRLTTIVSFDRDFDRIPGLQRREP